MTGIVMNFRGQEYRIPEEKAFVVGEQIEDIVTLPDLMAWGQRPKFHKIARCYGLMLRFAGCKVSDEDVHSEMMAQVHAMAAGGADQEEAAKQVLATQAIGALIAVLMGGAPQGGSAAPGKTSAS